MAVDPLQHGIFRPELQPTTPPTPANTPGLIPLNYSTQIIEMAREQSLAMSYFRTVRMPNAATVMPVLDALPVARWVTGEVKSGALTEGKKGVTAQRWKGIKALSKRS